MVIHSFDGVLRQRRTMHSFQVSWMHRVPLYRPIPYIAFYFYFPLMAIVVATFNRVIPVYTMLNAALSTLSGGQAGIAAWLAYYVAIPLGVVWIAFNVEIDGRSPHRWVVSCARFITRRKRLWCGQRARSDGERVRYRGRMRVWWDISAPRLHHGYVRGGRVTTAVPVRFTHALRHTAPVMKADNEHSPTVGYEVPGRIEVRP